MITESFIVWPKYWGILDAAFAAQVQASLTKAGVTVRAVRVTKNYAPPHPQNGQHFVIEVDTESGMGQIIDHALIKRDFKGL